ncbi:MAG TPA: alpha/beta hydrolase [Bryobacteraceae bacterium]|nr:alpha/beta hydrolase [Bryobacteraceae bacterium]
MNPKRMTRRTLLAASGGAIVAGMQSRAQSSKRIETPTLNIGYEESGRGFPVILLHGFPDDAHAWEDVAPPLVKAGYRVLAPYLRGYGPTSFRDPNAPRMAEQAAIGQDVIDFAEALGLDRFALSGYDWGGRAACIAAVLHPDRVRAAVLISGYLIQNTVDPAPPGSPETEKNLWYQYYFNTERGRAGLSANRRAICRFLWQTWSPTWHFTAETFDRTAGSFDNPDFVDCVIHSYRHRIGNAPGDPRFRELEERLAKRPKIEVPTIILRGADDTLGGREPAESADKAAFPNLITRRMIEGGGHFLPREKPQAVSAALLEVLAASA